MIYNLFMITGILKTINTPKISTFSNRLVSGNIARLNPRLKGIRLLGTQPIAQGHEQELLTDKAEPLVDPVTLEIALHNQARFVPPQTTLNNKFVSRAARHKAEHSGKITVTQSIHRTNPVKKNMDMPYGADVATDKATNQALLLRLKNQYLLSSQ